MHGILIGTGGLLGAGLGAGTVLPGAGDGIIPHGVGTVPGIPVLRRLMAVRVGALLQDPWLLIARVEDSRSSHNGPDMPTIRIPAETITADTTATAVPEQHRRDRNSRPQSSMATALLPATLPLPPSAQAAVRTQPRVRLHQLT